MSGNATKGGGKATRPDPAPAPERPAPNPNQPVHVVRLRNIRAAIWANTSEQAGTWYNVTLSRLYKDGEDQWRTSESFGRDDLLLLAKVADLAHSWISERLQASEPAF